MTSTPTPHIADRIRDALLADGWKQAPSGAYVKLIDSFEEGGTVSPTGARLVTLSMDLSGRWLERRDAWGDVENDVDLRDWSDDPAGAIAAVLGRRKP